MCTSFHRRVVILILVCGLPLAMSAGAQQIDIPGPLASIVFGSAVAVLPNGNIVVTDPYRGAISNTGAVYLYSPAGTLINFFTGSSFNDHVGSGGITVLTNGNFVISSPNWNNGTIVNAGAVTWINGSSGLSGAVSVANSLVGSRANDSVGGKGVYALTNGNYVVASPGWANNTNAIAGAVTWADGSTGLAGVVSIGNSLVGTTAFDSVGSGGVTALSNGNCVVVSPGWNNGVGTEAGAVTWVSGSTGLAGAVSASNSLVGARFQDFVGNGGVTALSNGNYVIASPNWDNGVARVGATTWADGSTGLSGAITGSNSLVGFRDGDDVGSGGVTALSDGDYVVASPNWSTVNANVGAVTRGNGSMGIAGLISVGTSLYGTTAGDNVGSGNVTALSNGNYVIASDKWHNGSGAEVGAVTWVNGNANVVGPITAANSLVGTTNGDDVGSRHVTALGNGNYVVSSPNWVFNGTTAGAGAVTWADGSTGLSGVVSAANSLVGTTVNDFVGGAGVHALSNGNYVVTSPSWANGQTTQVGAVTWANGNTGLSGPVSASNSLVGITAFDNVGDLGVTALSNGNYVVASYQWHNNATANAGAVTWADGGTGLSGPVSAANSLIGTTANDYVGSAGTTALSNGNYAVCSPAWNNGMTAAAGAISLGRGDGSLTGPILATNSVLGTATDGGGGLVFAYDTTHDQLVVGQPASNIVSLFSYDLIFANGFE
jgi:Repeat of unknown function (DUF5650)